MTLLIRAGNASLTIFRQTLDANKRFIKKVRPITFKLKPYVPLSEYTEEFDYDKKNKLLNRPLSPHLSIHKMLFNMATSGMHRFTEDSSNLLRRLGLLMTSYVMSLGVSALLFPSFLQWVMTCNMPLLLHIAVKAAIAGPICYHYVSGIRMLIWICGKYITKKDIHLTGYITLGLAAVLTCFVVLL